jgi:hypothetical protein
LTVPEPYPDLGATSLEMNVSVGSIATEIGFRQHVRFPSDSERTADIAGGPVGA